MAPASVSPVQPRRPPRRPPRAGGRASQRTKQQQLFVRRYAMTTELRLNARVVCADGPAGHLTDLILDPTSDQVTHLVVEVKGFGRPQHLVPVTLVQTTSTREVRLQCS